MKTKIIAGIIAGGIVISGITYIGGEYVPSIKQNIDKLKREALEAIADTEFLKGVYNDLECLSDSSIIEVNERINALIEERDGLYSQVKDLSKQLAESGEGMESARNDVKKFISNDLDYTDLLFIAPTGELLVVSRWGQIEYKN